jgi:putative transposase
LQRSLRPCWRCSAGRAALQIEILALRHQLGVLQRSAKRPRLTAADRFLWAWLYRVWADRRSVLVIVKPEAVIAWHRKGFRLFWTWKVRHGQPGRPPVPKDIRDLIRKMSRENPLWGAPRIHGELLKLGIDVGETSVSKYLVRHRKPPSQTWRTFLLVLAHDRRRIAHFNLTAHPTAEWTAQQLR